MSGTNITLKRLSFSRQRFFNIQNKTVNLLKQSIFLRNVNRIISIDAQELANECGSQALNPNELGAVLKVLSLLAVEFEADTAAELSTVRVGFTTAWQACSIRSILGSE